MRDCHVTWEGLFKETRGGRKWEVAGGLNADYTVKLKLEILS